MYVTRLIRRKPSRETIHPTLIFLRFATDWRVNSALDWLSRARKTDLFLCKKKNRSTVSLTNYVIYLPYSIFVVKFFCRYLCGFFSNFSDQRLRVISVSLVYVHIYCAFVRYCFTLRLLNYVLWLHFNFTTDLTEIPNACAGVPWHVFKQYRGKNPRCKRFAYTKQTGFAITVRRVGWNLVTPMKRVIMPWFFFFCPCRIAVQCVLSQIVY